MPADAYTLRSTMKSCALRSGYIIRVAIQFSDGDNDRCISKLNIVRALDPICSEKYCRLDVLCTGWTSPLKYFDDQRGARVKTALELQRPLDIGTRANMAT